MWIWEIVIRVVIAIPFMLLAWWGFYSWQLRRRRRSLTLGKSVAFDGAVVGRVDYETPYKGFLVRDGEDLFTTAYPKSADRLRIPVERLQFVRKVKRARKDLRIQAGPSWVALECQDGETTVYTACEPIDLEFLGTIDSRRAPFND